MDYWLAILFYVLEEPYPILNLLTDCMDWVFRTFPQPAYKKFCDIALK
jgi:hypothetical protein